MLVNTYTRIIFFFVLLLSAGSALAQTGKIEGVITDKKSRETLVGATVLIVGTNTGVITDLDGHFSIPNLKPGKYKVQISFISYNPVIYDNVTVEANKTTLLNTPMDEVSVTLQNVEVVAVRKSGSEISMINSVKASQLVSSGISGQQIQKSQDKDASEVIRRVPGVTINDDRFVIVRGLNQRYNNVWLNNSSTPSSETDVRAFSFDVIPSGMIDNLMVYKSGAPEFPSDFSGGFINIVTRNMPDSSFITLDYSTGYRSGTTFGDFKKYQGGKLDWLGIDDGSRALPAGFPSDWSKVEGNGTEINTLTKKFKNSYGISTNRALPDQKFGITLAKRMKVKKVTIGNMTVLNYNNANKYYANNNNAFAVYNVENDALSYKYTYLDRVYSNNVSWSVLHNWAFSLGSNHKIEFRNLFNQNGFTRTTLREGQFLENFRDEKSYQERFMSRSTYSGQLGGDHYLRQGNTRINWTLGYSLANRNEPDRKVLVSSRDEYSGKYQLIVNQSNPQPNLAGRFYQKTNEHIVSSAVNLDNKFNLFSIRPSLKAGYFGEWKSRTFNARNIGYVTGNQFSTYPDSVLYLPIDRVFVQSNLDYSTKISIAEQTNKSDSYTAGNNLIAGYVALNIPVSSTLNIYGGVRVENNEMKLASYRQDQPDVPVNVDNKQLNFFPSANISLNFTSKTLVRLAYARSVNRPEFREIAPYYYVDFDRNASFRGNPALKDADIQNMDIRLEHYPSNGEMLSLALFYKKFTNPIEAVISNEGSGKSFTFANAAGAENYGVEFDARKVLARQGFLQNMSVVANGSFIKSKVKFEGAEKQKSHDRPLQGQSQYIANIGLFYSNPTFRLTATALYNVVGKRIYAVGIVNQNTNDDIPDEYEMPRNIVDLAIAKKLGRFLEIKLGVKDMLNQPVEYSQTFIYVKNGVTQKRVGKTNSYIPGSLFSLGASLRF